jgi:outer membrane lipoprotein-sorting protein
MPRTAQARKLRWLAPVGVLAVIAALAAAPALASTSPPSLPALTAQQLLTRIQQATPPQALSGTIRLTTNLGIPNLSDLTGRADGAGLNPFSFLSGSRDARIWLDGPDRTRLAMLDQLAETDIIHNGKDVWIWQSAGSLVTHNQLKASQPDPAKPEVAPEPVTTPDQLAKQFLAKIDPSTLISVRTPDWVAGHSVYQLVLAPRTADSTIRDVAIAVDSRTMLPLRVTVTPKGSTHPAVELGFTRISLSRPAASTFIFTPPPGSHLGPAVAQPRRHGRAELADGPPAGADVLGGSAGPASQQVVGQDWTSVVIARGTPLPNGADAVLKAATAVPGGRLLHTSLLNVLLLDDGRIAVGAVTPGALQAAVAGAH